MNYNKNTAFTLVELIVVITILAILGTIAFISLQGYSAESRDSKRISDLGQIRTGLQIEQAREGIVPLPSNYVEIGSGSIVLSYQGYAGTGVLNTLKVSDNAKDPIDDNYYTYSVSGNQERFQLLAMLENGENISKNNFVSNIYANYEDREEYLTGDSIGILLENVTKRPIQENGSDIDLSSNGNNYRVAFSRDNTITSSGAELFVKINRALNDDLKEKMLFSGTCLDSWYNNGTLSGIASGKDITFNNVYNICSGTNLNSISNVVTIGTCPTGWEETGTLSGIVSGRDIVLNTKYITCSKTY